MFSFRYQRFAGATAVVLDAVVLRVGWVPPTKLMNHLARPRRWVDAVGTDGATLELTRAGLWLVGVWMALAVVTVLASGLPGALGRVANRVAGRAVPAVLRRAIATALGASVVLMPVAAGGSTGTHGGARATTSTTAAASSTAALSPTSASPAMAGRPAVPASKPGATQLSGGWPWPASAPTPTSTSTSTQESAPASGDPVKPVPWPRTAIPGPSAPRPTSGVVVRAGDCLWAIAAHRLGPDASAQRVASETRRWYEANTATIGRDPSLIHPGQQLHQPTEKGR